MIKFLLPILAVVFLVGVFRFIGRFIRNVFSAPGRRSRKPQVPTLHEGAVDKTLEISDQMIMESSESFGIQLDGPEAKSESDYGDMARNMQILGDTSLIEPLPQPNTAVIKETIQEVDFYIEQDLLTDARILLDDLARRAPDHELLKHRRHHLNHVAKTNRPGVIPLEDQPTRIVDYAELAASRAAAK